MTKTHESYAQSWVFGVNFWGTLCPFDSSWVKCNRCVRKKHKAQVELLQLRIPFEPKKTESPGTKLEQSHEKKHWSIAYSQNTYERKYQPLSKSIYIVEFNKGLTYWHKNARWLHSRVHIGMLHFSANTMEFVKLWFILLNSTSLHWILRLWFLNLNNGFTFKKYLDWKSC